MQWSRVLVVLGSCQVLALEKHGDVPALPHLSHQGAL